MRPGGDAEADGVGKGVHLDAELGLGVREPGDAAVHAVKKHGKEDGDGGGVEVAVHGGDDAVEGGEERGSGECVRKNVDALAFDRAEAALADRGQAFAMICVVVAHLSCVV